ncbi:MAG: TIGR01244 family phosphatase [Sphingomonadales bacterium]|nr:TIGR01244 family phosphatase [Sphingomonadales bacterium]MDE2169036.1 TIGR01244 family phosphatase [Sphingomonadales bacterium]
MFRRLTDQLLVSPQIDLDDLAEAARLGVRHIINNRPEGESDDQTPGPVIEQAARAAGMTYIAIPVTHAGFSQEQVDAMVETLGAADGAILAYCRSGTRSTLLWALAQASKGMSAGELAPAAAAAGYDISPIRPLIDMLSGKTD